MQRTTPRGRARTEGPALALDLHSYLLCLNADKPTCSAWKPGLTHKAKRHVLKKIKKSRTHVEKKKGTVSLFTSSSGLRLSPPPHPRLPS